MKNIKKLKTAFGINEYNFIDFPKKYSNVKISRILNYEDRGGCPYCFPHGIECNNSTFRKIQKSWKKTRQKQFKLSNIINIYIPVPYRRRDRINNYYDESKN